MIGGLVCSWRTDQSVVAGNLISALPAAGALLQIPALGLPCLMPGLITDCFERNALAVAVQIALFCFAFARRTSHQQRQLDVMANRDPLTGAGS